MDEKEVNITDAGNSEGTSKKLRFKTKYARIGFVSFVVIASSIVFYFCLFENRTLFGFLRSILSFVKPFIAGAAFAYLMKPLCRVFEGWTGQWFKKVKSKSFQRALIQNVSIFFTIVIFAASLYILFSAILPQVIASIKSLIESFPETYEKIMTWLKDISEGTPFEDAIRDFDENSYSKLEEWMSSLNLEPARIVTEVTDGLKGLLGFLKNVLVGSVACVYILSQRRRLAAQGKMVIYSIFKEKHADNIMGELQYVDKMFSGFIFGKIIDSLIIGLLTFAVISIVKIPYPVLISVIVCVTNIIPFFGPWIGAIPAALIILMTDPIKCLYFCIIIIIIQQLDGNIIGPKILGNTTGLSSFWVLFSIILFGGMFGFVGMIIAVPLFAVIYDITRKAVKAGLKKRNKESMYAVYEADLAREEARKRKERRERKKRIRKHFFSQNDNKEE